MNQQQQQQQHNQRLRMDSSLGYCVSVCGGAGA